MGAIKQWLLEEHEREIAEQYCPECGREAGHEDPLCAAGRGCGR
jgi:hypothetical protein